MASIPASTPASTLRATVQADAADGAAVSVLVDGSDTAITANGLAHYQPSNGDRVLVQKVGGQVEIMQFITRGVAGGGSSPQRATVEADATNPGDPATVLIDGASSNVTAAGLAGYLPRTGNIVIVEDVAGTLTIMTLVAYSAIIGQIIQTAETGPRIELEVASDGRLSFFTADEGVHEDPTAPAGIDVTFDNTVSSTFDHRLLLQSAGLLNGSGSPVGNAATLYLSSVWSTLFGALSHLVGEADAVNLISHSTFNISGTQIVIDGSSGSGVTIVGTIQIVGSLNVGTGGAAISGGLTTDTVTVGGGTKVNAMSTGTVTATTSASGVVTITHALGQTPTAVFVESVGAGGTVHLVNLTSFTSTQATATVRSVTAAGATVNSTSVTLRWFAIG